MKNLGPLRNAEGTIIRHGASAYSNLGCRCEECKTGWRVYMKRRRYERREMLQQDPSLAQHGRRNTYLNWMCRCKKCLAANSKYKSG